MTQTKNSSLLSQCYAGICVLSRSRDFVYNLFWKTVFSASNACPVNSLHVMIVSHVIVFAYYNCKQNSKEELSWTYRNIINEIDVL